MFFPPHSSILRDLNFLAAIFGRKSFDCNDNDSLGPCLRETMQDRKVKLPFLFNCWCVLPHGKSEVMGKKQRTRLSVELESFVSLSTEKRQRIFEIEREAYQGISSSFSETTVFQLPQTGPLRSNSTPIF